MGFVVLGMSIKMDGIDHGERLKQVLREMHKRAFVGDNGKPGGGVATDKGMTQYHIA